MIALLLCFHSITPWASKCGRVLVLFVIFGGCFSIHVYWYTENIVFMDTSSCIGQCATFFSNLGLFNYPLNEAACPLVSTVYSPIMPSEGIYTFMRVHYHDCLC